MRTSVEITYEIACRFIAYDSATGKFRWLRQSVDAFVGCGNRSAEHICRNWNAKFAEKEAFTALDNNGYGQGWVRGNHMKAHRLAWLMHYAEWPKAPIDHINGVKSDNRIVNLRSVSLAENNKNLPIPVHNKSGVIGVSWHPKTGKWRAQIQVRKLSIHIGLFDELDSAALARKAAEGRYGFHQNHGRVPQRNERAEVAA